MTQRSQCDRVLAVLRDGRPHTMTEIHQRAGTMRLNSRISELRNRGHDITCDRGRNPVYQLLPTTVPSERLLMTSAGVDPGAAPTDVHTCPRSDECALNNGAIHCFACGRNWPPDETWETSDIGSAPGERDAELSAVGTASTASGVTTPDSSRSPGADTSLAAPEQRALDDQIRRPAWA